MCTICQTVCITMPHMDMSNLPYFLEQHDAYCTPPNERGAGEGKFDEGIKVGLLSINR